jgi:hypothetical protein
VSREALLERLDAVERRLLDHAAAAPPSGLTSPDADTGERWEAGQVWAHLAEFPAYWLEQVDRVIAEVQSGASQPVRFGRTRTDPGRLAAIEQDRDAAVAELLLRLREGIGLVRAAVAELPDDAWRVRGCHPTLGEMDVAAIIERFIATHLEEHAHQLDQLAADAAGKADAADERRLPPDEG